jgi:hypothetical protein
MGDVLFYYSGIRRGKRKSANAAFRQAVSILPEKIAIDFAER